MDAVWLGLVLTCAWMAAISAYVGAVHYPSFVEIPSERWDPFHQFHCHRTGFCVLLPMTGQSVATALLVTQAAQNWASWAMLGCWLASVGWTLAVSAPLHQRLSSGKSEPIIRRLVATNHPRTVAWLAGALCAGTQLLA